MLDLRSLKTAAGAFAMAGAAEAATLDQSFEAESPGIFFSVSGSAGLKAQSFTVGLDGVLESVSVKIQSEGSTKDDTELTVSIREVRSNGALRNLLTRETVQPVVPLSLGFFNVAFSTRPTVSVGDTLAIVLEANGAAQSGGFQWFASGRRGVYDRGDSYRDDNTSGALGALPSESQSRDFGFRTFVDANPTVIPLPAAAWLLIGGLGALGAVARRGA